MTRLQYRAGFLDNRLIGPFPILGPYLAAADAQEILSYAFLHFRRQIFHEEFDKVAR